MTKTSVHRPGWFQLPEAARRQLENAINRRYRTNPDLSERDVVGTTATGPWIATWSDGAIVGLFEPGTHDQLEPVAGITIRIYDPGDWAVFQLFAERFPDYAVTEPAAYSRPTLGKRYRVSWVYEDSPQSTDMSTQQGAYSLMRFLVHLDQYGFAYSNMKVGDL